MVGRDACVESCVWMVSTVESRCYKVNSYRLKPLKTNCQMLHCFHVQLYPLHLSELLGKMLHNISVSYLEKCCTNAPHLSEVLGKVLHHISVSYLDMCCTSFMCMCLWMNSAMSASFQWVTLKSVSECDSESVSPAQVHYGFHYKPEPGHTFVLLFCKIIVERFEQFFCLGLLQSAE